MEKKRISSPFLMGFEMNTNQLETIENEMTEIINETDLNIELNEITLRVGNKVLRFSKEFEEEISIEDEVQREYDIKLANKLNVMKDKIKGRMSNVMEILGELRDEYDRKENLLKDQMKQAGNLPKIDVSHARKGLSVYSINHDELLWLVLRTYNPKYLDFKPLNDRIVNRMIKHMRIRIRTKGQNVAMVSTVNIDDLNYFPHYHQVSPDCWGDWKYAEKWETPDDIIAIANEATAVLENINSWSLGNQRPSGLPMIGTIRRNVIPENQISSDTFPTTNSSSVDIWTTT